MADGIITDEVKAMCVADGTRRPSMRARTPAKLDSFARCRAPHHVPQSRRRSSFSEHEKRHTPSLPSSEAVRAFSALARPLSLRLVSPRGALPLRCSPVSVSVSVSVCTEESRLTSMDISTYVRVTTRHEAKPLRKTDRDDSSWKFRGETLSFGM